MFLIEIFLLTQSVYTTIVNHQSYRQWRRVNSFSERMGSNHLTTETDKVVKL